MLIEKDDDVEFVSESGVKSLASLKHKAMGDTPDKSFGRLLEVRPNLARPLLGEWQDFVGEPVFPFTTATCSKAPFSPLFVEDAADDDVRAQAAQNAIAKSRSEVIGTIRTELTQLSEDEVLGIFMVV